MPTTINVPAPTGGTPKRFNAIASGACFYHYDQSVWKLMRKAPTALPGGENGMNKATGGIATVPDTWPVLDPGPTQVGLTPVAIPPSPSTTFANVSPGDSCLLKDGNGTWNLVQRAAVAVSGYNGQRESDGGFLQAQDTDVAIPLGPTQIAKA